MLGRQRSGETEFAPDPEGECTDNPHCLPGRIDGLVFLEPFPRAVAPRVA